nr:MULTISPECIES: erythromycin esterase family protein [unclassified Dehalobacter]
MDAVAGGGYEDAEILLSPYKHKTAVVKILEMLNRIPGETINDEISRLKMVLATIKELELNLKKFLDEKQYNLLYEHVLTLLDSFKFNLIANSADTYKQLNLAMAAREKAIHRHVKFVLSMMKPSDKLVLMGHNRHLSKDISAIKNGGAAPPGGGHVPSVGTYINQLLPGQVFSIWQLFNQGSSSQPYVNLNSKYVSRPDTLNAILAKIGSNFLIPTAGPRLFEKSLDIVGIYNAEYRTAITKQADAIFFIDEVSPLRK